MPSRNFNMECACHSPEHELKFQVWDDGDTYVHVFLRPEPFFKRVVNGIKYIFGYQCQYGHFDEFVLNPEDINKFIEMFQYIDKVTERRKVAPALAKSSESK